MSGDPNLYMSAGYNSSSSTQQLPGPGINNSQWSSELQVCSGTIVMSVCAAVFKLLWVVFAI
jgi:hypothetical protein